MQAFRITLNDKVIDTVFQSCTSMTIKDKQEEVYKSLVNHDGYDPAIIVKLIGRNTFDEYHVEGCYNGQWEMVNCETTWKDAKRSIKEYRENEGGLFRIVKSYKIYDFLSACE